MTRELTKAEQLERLKAEILERDICPELRTGATQLVLGDGNPDAKIVLIGEAPGEQEDKQGLPFVGASGRFLNEMLEAASLVRSDIYITNIVKYRPPGNRDPLPEEKRAFWPYLMKQLEIINPRVIITLGKHSMECFIPGATISQQHGKPKRVKYHDSEFLVIPLYHPAAALYNGSMRQNLIDDFLAAKTLADSALV